MGERGIEREREREREREMILLDEDDLVKAEGKIMEKTDRQIERERERE